jgi:hypothetical protein
VFRSDSSRQDALRAAAGLPGRLRYLPTAAASWLTAWLRGAELQTVRLQSADYADWSRLAEVHAA